MQHPAMNLVVQDIPFQSDGMTRFFDTGHFAYHALTRENRGQLLFDRHNQIFILAAKSPLPDLVGPSTIDPSSE